MAYIHLAALRARAARQQEEGSASCMLCTAGDSCNRGIVVKESFVAIFPALYAAEKAKRQSLDENFRLIPPYSALFRLIPPYSA